MDDWFDGDIGLSGYWCNFARYTPFMMENVWEMSILLGETMLKFSYKVIPSPGGGGILKFSHIWQPYPLM